MSLVTMGSGAVTQLKQADTERREWLSEQRSALALAASQEGQWEWRVASGDMFVSERAQHLLGLEPAARVRPRSEWLERVCWHPEDAPRWRAELEAFLAGSAAHYDGEWRVRQLDGGFRWIRGRTACLRSAAGHAEHVAGSLLDIDAQKNSEALAGSIAHDFNNILGAIIGYGEMALLHVPSGSRLQRDLDAIMFAGERGRALVDHNLACLARLLSAR